MRMMRLAGLLLLALAPAARSEPADFAAIAPLAGRYVGPITCGAFKADWSMGIGKAWEDDHAHVVLTVDTTRKVCPEKGGCGTFPDGALGKAFPAEREGYRLEGSVATPFGPIEMQGSLKIADDPKDKNAKMVEMTASSTLPPGLVTVKARGRIFKTPPPGERPKLENEKSQYEYIRWEGEIKMPTMTSPCSGKGRKRVFLFVPPGGIYDPKHKGETPPQ